MPRIINACVCCGTPIADETRQVCPKCEYNAGQQLFRKLEQLNAKIRDGRLVEIVYCQDCIYYHDDHQCPMQKVLTTSEYDYCSRGERKEDDD